MIGRYRLLDVLGSGGMGEVYRAEDTRTGAAVAIKTLLPELVDSPAIRRRFEREGETAGFLQHPNIVEVVEMGRVDDGRMYLAMELVRGESVGRLLEAGPIDARRALGIARQSLLALDFAHQHGLVHRDLKPDNIMVESPTDRVKILDFGVVKILAVAAELFGAERLTETGVTFGTPLYMAPEQALARGVDGRSDLYSLGVILFEMLTGAPPFHSDSSMEVLRMHVSREPPSLYQMAPGVPWYTDSIGRLVSRALAKRPTARFADARAMIAGVDEALASIDYLS